MTATPAGSSGAGPSRTMPQPSILVLYNEPVLPANHPHAGSEYDISSLKNSQFQMRWWWVVAVETPCLTGDDVVIGFSKDDDSVIVIFDNVATNFRVPRQYSRDEILRTILLEGVDRMVEKFGRH